MVRHRRVNEDFLNERACILRAWARCDQFIPRIKRVSRNHGDIAVAFVYLIESHKSRINTGPPWRTFAFNDTRNKKSSLKRVVRAPFIFHPSRFIKRTGEFSN